MTRGDTRGAAVSLSSRTAVKLEAFARQWPDDTLPSLPRLAERFGVSVPTVLEAVHTLRDKGILAVRRGSRIRVVRETPANTPTSKTERVASAVRMHGIIRERIAEGVYRTGRPLPKRLHFAVDAAVSPGSVTRALRLLAQEGLVHKRGKRWYPGRERAGDAPVNVNDRRVILLLMRDELFWRDHVRRPERTGSFGAVFDLEADRHDVTILPLINHRVFQVEVPGFALGLDRAVDLARRHENRYLGSLVAGEEDEIPGLAQLIGRMVGLKRPVVWFDRYGRTPVRAVRRYFTRCYFSEEGALRAALDHLAAHGHRKVGFYPPGSAAWDQWGRRRAEGLQRIGATMAPLVEIIVYPPGENANGAVNDERYLRGVFDRLYASAGPLVDSCDGLLAHLEMFPKSVRNRVSAAGNHGRGGRLAALYRSSREVASLDIPRELAVQLDLIGQLPAIAQLLRHPNLTALIVASDAFVPGLYGLLQAARVSVPGELSLISFDNSVQAQPYRVSTVDMGFDYLGYSAFHAILKDIPLKHDPAGGIATPGRVVERGTVGMPRRRRMKLDFTSLTLAAPTGR